MTPHRFFLDRGLGSRMVVRGLRDAGWSVTSMDERYGSARSQDVADVDWIRDAAAQGEVLLSKDRAIARRPLEAEAIYYNEARVFVIASAQITGPEMLSRVIGNASAIERIGGQHGPFVFAIYEASVARLRLNYP